MLSDDWTQFMYVACIFVLVYGASCQPGHAGGRPCIADAGWKRQPTVSVVTAGDGVGGGAVHCAITLRFLWPARSVLYDRPAMARHIALAPVSRRSVTVCSRTWSYHSRLQFSSSRVLLVALLRLA